MRPSIAMDAYRAEIHEIVRRHRARNPRVFGSVARGEDTETSDLDLLVDPDPGMTLFDIGAICNELEAMLGVPVDLVTPRALSAKLADSIACSVLPV